MCAIVHRHDERTGSTFAAQSWALEVFLNFFNNKKWFFAFFIILITYFCTSRVVFTKLTQSQIDLKKMQENHFLLLKKFPKNLKCPALHLHTTRDYQFDNTPPQTSPRRGGRTCSSTPRCSPSSPASPGSTMPGSSGTVVGGCPARAELGAFGIFEFFY